ncbi:hypothetical protein [Leptospira meyeri]|uniref:hypothetical protein n=1 Tax=Leptospira meyeri TaxID=29508 RepID=UPI000C2AE1A1|nr:hypothetical protein [Leptospira meyeri]PKA11041.1 hypothetical protein CH372_16205 [Leptospira meyeri]PKA24862.1 hypothetical protein CH381_18655 [Leptospira sp. mixed culture ATI2-C-A1]TGM23652.1 hypothetical protein EHQ73_00995 [Leptospira meyeri]
MKTLHFSPIFFISCLFLLLFVRCSNTFSNHSIDSCRKKCDVDQSLCYMITLQSSSINTNQVNLTCPLLYIGCHSKCDSKNQSSSSRITSSNRSGSRSGGGGHSSSGGGHSSSGGGGGSSGGSSGGGHGGGGH